MHDAMGSSLKIKIRIKIKTNKNPKPNYTEVQGTKHIAPHLQHITQTRENTT